MKYITLLLCLAGILHAAPKTVEFCDPYLVAAPTNQKIEPVRAAAQPPGKGKPPKTPAVNWSDPKTWGDAVPAAGAAVSIPEGKNVILDTDTAPLASLEIRGTLQVAAKNTSLTTGYVLIHATGTLIAGSPTTPHPARLDITLTGTDRNATVMGGRVMGVMGGGKLLLYGVVPSPTWGFLAENTPATVGATTLTLANAPNWRPGDQIIVTSTDFDYQQTELRTISSISGSILSLSSPLQHLHGATITRVAHGVPGVPTEIDQRAEVANLSRNIRIQSPADSESEGFGGHVMVMDDASQAHLQGVELFRMGQAGLVGRYPIHWHNVNDGGANSFMVGCSVHRAFNRGTTIHKTNNLRISDNTLYDIRGHGYFFEDGKETGNVLTRNLVALVHNNPLDVSTEPNSTRSRVSGASSAYWVSNPNNHLHDNVAAGVHPSGFGFWYDIHSTPRPGSISADPTYRPNRQPFGTFRGNRAHSTVSNPNLLESGWGFFMEEVYNNGTFEAQDFTAFANQGGQMWFTGGSPFEAPTNFIARRARLLGSNALFNEHLNDSLVLGSTDPLNLGRTALIGYDVVADATNTVFGNFRGVYRVRNEASESLTACTFLNDANYRTYILGNVNNLAPDVSARTMLSVHNPEDSFQNGAPGMFTTTELLTDLTSKSFAQGARGIHPDDPIWWSPFSRAEFMNIGFDNPDWFKPGTTHYEVFTQPANHTKVFPARYASDNNGGIAYQTIVRQNILQRVTFTGTVQNTNLIITMDDIPNPANQAGYVVLELPTPTSMPYLEASSYGTSYPIYHAASLADFQASTEYTVFFTPSSFYAKLPIRYRKPLAVIGYTLP